MNVLIELHVIGFEILVDCAVMFPHHRDSENEKSWRGGKPGKLVAAWLDDMGEDPVYHRRDLRENVMEMREGRKETVDLDIGRLRTDGSIRTQKRDWKQFIGALLDEGATAGGSGNRSSNSHVTGMMSQVSSSVGPYSPTSLSEEEQETRDQGQHPYLSMIQADDGMSGRRFSAAWRDQDDCRESGPCNPSQDRSTPQRRSDLNVRLSAEESKASEPTQHRSSYMTSNHDRMTPKKRSYYDVLSAAEEPKASELAQRHRTEMVSRQTVEGKSGRLYTAVKQVFEDGEAGPVPVPGESYRLSNVNRLICKYFGSSSSVAECCVDVNVSDAGSQSVVCTDENGDALGRGDVYSARHNSEDGEGNVVNMFCVDVSEHTSVQHGQLEENLRLPAYPHVVCAAVDRAGLPALSAEVYPRAVNEPGLFTMPCKAHQAILEIYGMLTVSAEVHPMAVAKSDSPVASADARCAVGNLPGLPLVSAEMWPVAVDIHGSAAVSAKVESSVIVSTVVANDKQGKEEHLTKKQKTGKLEQKFLVPCSQSQPIVLLEELQGSPIVSASVHSVSGRMPRALAVSAEVDLVAVDTPASSYINQQCEQYCEIGEVEGGDIVSGEDYGGNKISEHEGNETTATPSPGCGGLGGHEELSQGPAMPSADPVDVVRGVREAWKRRKKKAATGIHETSGGMQEQESVYLRKYGVEEAWARRRAKDLLSPSV